MPIGQNMLFDFIDGTCSLVILHVQNHRTVGYRILCSTKEAKSNLIFAFVSSYIDAILWIYWRKIFRRYASIKTKVIKINYPNLPVFNSISASLTNYHFD